MNQKIVISSNSAWSIHNYRSGLIKALIDQGYQVTAVAPEDDYAKRIRALGCGFIALPMDNHGTNPGRDLLLLSRYVRLLLAERPLVYLGYTVKPNVYGSMAAHMVRVPVVNNIAGLGATFVERNLLTRIVRGLYRCGLFRSHRVFFQNREDQEMFIESGVVRRGASDRLPGSGIDLTRYQPDTSIAPDSSCFRFLLVSRMLRYKGIVEYVEAARIIRKSHPNAVFQLLGFVDKGDKNAITIEELKAWEADGAIQYLGDTDDVSPYLAKADCVVLPSFYREGVPRSLLEAAAMARPIITTDNIGCREVVDDCVNGYVCMPKDVKDLAEKMMKMIKLPHAERIEMGKAGRRKVEFEFDEKLVIQKYLDVIRDIPRNSARGAAAGKPYAPIAENE